MEGAAPKPAQEGRYAGIAMLVAIGLAMVAANSSLSDA